MNEQERHRAAKALKASPLWPLLVAELDRTLRDEFANTAPDEAARREECYHGLRGLQRLQGQLDVWASQPKTENLRPL